MISEQNIFVGFDVGILEALTVGFLKIERLGKVDSGEFVYGKNDLQAETAIAIYPEIFPLRVEPFQIPLRRLRGSSNYPAQFCMHRQKTIWKK